MGQPMRVTTDAQGRAKLTVKIRPGEIALPLPRVYTDSQLYFFGDHAGWQSWGAYGSPMGANCVQNVLVFNTHAPVANPTWQNLGAIFQRYARIYPGMSAKLDIGDEATVKTFAALLIDLLSRDSDDPSYMADTRDLSSYHRGMRLTYLKSIGVI